MSRIANLNGCYLRFEEVHYQLATGIKINFRAVIYNRPGQEPNLVVEMGDWDNLLFYMDSLFTKYNVRYPLPTVKYNEKFELISS